MFAYGPADATAIPKRHHLASFKSTLVLPFWYRLTQVVLEKKPLNGCGGGDGGCDGGYITRSLTGSNVTIFIEF